MPEGSPPLLTNLEAGQIATFEHAAHRLSAHTQALSRFLAGDGLLDQGLSALDADRSSSSKAATDSRGRLRAATARAFWFVVAVGLRNRG
jgi:hypothetical protein